MPPSSAIVRRTMIGKSELIGAHVSEPAREETAAQAPSIAQIAKATTFVR